MFCGEKKVKLFLNGLGYFLMLGHLEGIVTDYKAKKTASREIPISSCPAYVEDAVYGTTASLFIKKEDITLSLPTEESKKKNVRRKKADSSRIAKVRAFKEAANHGSGYEYVPVDTDGSFTFGGKDYQIDMRKVPAYAGKETYEGTLYDMDKVICMKMMDGNVSFFDMELSPIEDGIKEK